MISFQTCKPLLCSQPNQSSKPTLRNPNKENLKSLRTLVELRVQILCVGKYELHFHVIFDILGIYCHFADIKIKIKISLRRYTRTTARRLLGSSRSQQLQLGSICRQLALIEICQQMYTQLKVYRQSHCIQLSKILPTSNI